MDDVMVHKGIDQIFVAFVADLFGAEGFNVKYDTPVGDLRPDLVISSKTGATAVVEAKLYRSRIAPVSVLLQAAAQTEGYRRRIETDKAILVIGNKISALGRETLSQQHPDLVLYDVDTLAFLVAKHPSLVGPFDDLTRQATTFSDVIKPVLQIGRC